MSTIEVQPERDTVEGGGRHAAPLGPALTSSALTGTKYGCGVGQCGACTVHANGAAVRSLHAAAERVGNLSITTIEGVSAWRSDARCRRSGWRWTFTNAGTVQGNQIMSATALLTHTVRPGDADIDAAMAGNLCRCGCYPRIRAAIKHIGDSRTAGAATMATRIADLWIDRPAMLHAGLSDRRQRGRGGLLLAATLPLYRNTAWAAAGDEYTVTNCRACPSVGRGDHLYRPEVGQGTKGVAAGLCGGSMSHGRT